MNDTKVVIVPCSGIGKSYGTVTREAAYDVVEDLRPDETQPVSYTHLDVYKRQVIMRRA